MRLPLLRHAYTHTHTHFILMYSQLWTAVQLGQWRGQWSWMKQWWWKRRTAAAIATPRNVPLRPATYCLLGCFITACARVFFTSYISRSQLPSLSLFLCHTVFTLHYRLGQLISNGASFHSFISFYHSFTILSPSHSRPILYFSQWHRLVCFSLSLSLSRILSFSGRSTQQRLQ